MVFIQSAHPAFGARGRRSRPSCFPPVSLSVLTSLHRRQRQHTPLTLVLFLQGDNKCAEKTTQNPNFVRPLCGAVCQALINVWHGHELFRHARTFPRRKPGPFSTSHLHSARLPMTLVCKQKRRICLRNITSNDVECALLRRLRTANSRARETGRGNSNRLKKSRA